MKKTKLLIILLVALSLTACNTFTESNHSVLNNLINTPTPTPETVQPTIPAPTSTPRTTVPPGPIEISPTVIDVDDYYFDGIYKGVSEDDSYLEKYIETATSSSYLKSQGKNNYSPKNLLDYSLDTAWCEGVIGTGINEWFTIETKSSYTEGAKIPYIEIINGYTKDKSSFNSNGRVKKFLVVIDDKERLIFNLEDTMDVQRFEIPEIQLETDVSCYIKFIILEVYEGEKYDDTCITGVEIN